MKKINSKQLKVIALATLLTISFQSCKKESIEKTSTLKSKDRLELSSNEFDQLMKELKKL